jgi:hypothetical protein
MTLNFVNNFKSTVNQNRHVKADSVRKLGLYIPGLSKNISNKFPSTV